MEEACMENDKTQPKVIVVSSQGGEGNNIC